MIWQNGRKYKWHLGRIFQILISGACDFIWREPTSMDAVKMSASSVWINSPHLATSQQAWMLWRCQHLQWEWTNLVPQLVNKHKCFEDVSIFNECKQTHLVQQLVSFRVHLRQLSERLVTHKADLMSILKMKLVPISTILHYRNKYWLAQKWEKDKLALCLQN